MQCRNCGVIIPDGVRFCPKCGASCAGGSYQTGNGGRNTGNPAIPYQYEPLSPWAYLGYSFLFSIPLVGLILLIVFSLSNGNINRRNYARSFFCAFLIVLILAAAVLVLAAAGAVSLSEYM